MDSTARFLIHPSLHVFLSPQDRNAQPLTYSFRNQPSVKDAFEAIGVPHPEVETLLIDGTAADFAVPLHNEAHVYISGELIPCAQPLRPRLLRPLRFVLDHHLRRLMGWLRRLGVDCLWSEEWDDHQLAEISDLQNRVLLTRDMGLLKHKRVTYGRFLRSDDPEVQLNEVLAHYDLIRDIEPFKRCLVCNSILQTVEKDKIAHRLEQQTKRYFSEFFVCPTCERIYWKGSHFVGMQKWLRDKGFPVTF